MCHQVATPCQRRSSLSLSCGSIQLSRIPQAQCEPDGSIAKTCTTSKRTCASVPVPVPVPIPFPFPICDAKLVALGSAADAGVDCKNRSQKCRLHWQRQRQCENKARRVQNLQTDAVQQRSLCRALALFPPPTLVEHTAVQCTL